MSKKPPGRGDHLRSAIAQEAARLMAEHGIHDYLTAKRKAAERFGVSDASVLPKNTEVFIRGTIQVGEMLPSGSGRWFVRMKDGTLVEAVEDSGYMEKQAQAAQENSKQTALVSPEKPHRTLCAHGIYQGVAGKDPAKDAKIPLVSLLYAMDRKK